MRLFIAIPLSEAMRRALADAQAEMRRQNVRGNYTPPENLHLTLAFIGEYPDPEAAVEALPVPEPFDLTLCGIGAFGDLWWAGLERSDPLNDYVRTLRHALSDANIPFDRKRFSPHITLLRRAQGRPVLQIPQATMTARRVCPMRSDRGKNGMIYTEIGGVESV